MIFGIFQCFYQCLSLEKPSQFVANPDFGVYDTRYMIIDQFADIMANDKVCVLLNMQPNILTRCTTKFKK